jgi:hypothetical protein
VFARLAEAFGASAIARLPATHGETIKTLAIEDGTVRVPLAGHRMATLIVE